MGFLTKFLLIGALAVVGINGHGRMMKPPNRSSIWRVPEFAHLNPPANYDDLQLYCGAVHQADDPGTNCGLATLPGRNEITDISSGNLALYVVLPITGETRDIVCGDPASQARPRDNEFGGRYDAGIIAALYQAGQDIDIEVYLSAAHLGNMEFRLCTNPSAETQDCFNQNVLQLSNGSGSKLPVNNGPGTYTTRLRLPPNVRCDRCVIQWNYRGGNQWGDCGDGTSANGCGPQETFRGCADVRIY